MAQLSRTYQQTDKSKLRLRTCIGCGKKSSKEEFYRIVRSTTGNVRFDSTGRMAGRGAYVCSAVCLERSLGKLHRALKCSIPREDVVRVSSELNEALTRVSAR